MRRTSKAKEEEVLSLIMRGRSYQIVSDVTEVPISTIKKIRARNRVDHVSNEKLSSSPNRITACALLSRLNRSEEHLKKLDELNTLLSGKKISHREFLRRKRGLKPLSVTQLLEIAKYIQKQCA